jgi:hypothetical protein
MDVFFLVCATIGGTILVLQLALSLLGLGFEGLAGPIGDHLHLGDFWGHGGDAGTVEAGGGHGGFSHLGRVLTFQTVVAFLTFFGVGGKASLEAGRGPAASVLIAMGTGLGAMALLGWAFQGLRRLQTDGTIRIEDAVGLRGRVYLRIPAFGAGEGKVTLPIQGRTIEVRARTTGPALLTGEPAVVLRVIEGRILEVVAPEGVVEKPAALAE